MEEQEADPVEEVDGTQVNEEEVDIEEIETSPLDPSPGGEHTWLESLDGVEEGDTTAMWLFKLLIPFAIPAVIFVGLFFILDYSRFLVMGGMSLSYLFPPLGKESIIPYGIDQGFTIWQMTGLIFMVDVVCAMFISWNLPLAKKIPLIGRVIIWVEKKGTETLAKNPGLRTVSFIGLVLWVMVPFQGSGGITASIIGRAIGMRATHVISAVGVGAIIAGFLIATAAEKVMEVLRENLIVGVAMIAAVIIVSVVLYVLYKRYNKKKNHEAIEREGSA